MEFRQVVHSVCRTTAAATRPSLASTRPSASAMLLQRHHFTTNNKQQSEAAAAAAQPQQTQPPPHTTSSQYRVDKLRASLKNTSPTPPRPPPFRTGNFFEDPQRKKAAAPTWATPQNKSASPAPFGRRTTLTGLAPTAASGSTSSADNMFNLPSQIQSDMQSTTTSNDNMRTWNDDIFAAKYYGVEEPELRLRPSTGRTVHVQGNVDLARGFRLLDRAVRQNKIKSQVFLARHHERPALKRKRQKRERWAQRFKVGFRATIDRVMELKAQGW